MDNPYYELLINAAIRFVSYRPRSKKELTDYLNKKLTRLKVSGDGLITKVISRMEELGYAGDDKFAAWWVDQRTTFKPKGNRLITMELKAKGVPESVIVSALASRGSQSQLEAAKQSITRKQALWEKLPPKARKKKIYEYLGRRGFDFTTIARIIDERG